jgi:hypothetical protein
MADPVRPRSNDNARRIDVLGAGLGTQVLSASITFAVAMVLLSLGGRWLDRQWGTHPLFIILGAASAFVGGFAYLLKQLAPDMLSGAPPTGTTNSRDTDSERDHDDPDHEP